MDAGRPRPLQPTAAIAGYFALRGLTLLLNGGLLAVILLAGLKRDWTLHNLLLIFVVTAFASFIPLMSGGLIAPHQLKFGVCLLSSATGTGETCAMVSAGLSIVLRVFFRVIAAMGKFKTLSDSRILTIFLLALPWVTWAGFIIAGLASGAQDRSSIFQAVFYCASTHGSIGAASTYISAAGEVAIIVLEISVSIVLWRHWSSLRKISRGNNSSGNHQSKSDHGGASVGGLQVALVFRVGLFGLVVLLAFILAMVVGGNNFTNVTADLAVSSVGVFTFLIFASQDDVLRVLGIKKSVLTSTNTLTSHSRTKSYPLPRGISPSKSSSHDLVGAHDDGDDGTHSYPLNDRSVNSAGGEDEGAVTAEELPYASTTYLRAEEKVEEREEVPFKRGK